MLRIAGKVSGVVLIILGFVWTLQGLGFLMWPAESFMLGEQRWAANGVVAMAVGAVLFWLAFRRSDAT